ncbi:MAG: [Fe-Fe] hydrogenase large subunit C-terminal domain-containing protein [Planctomycetaceae bacterium]|nr:4Fe-4S dicluster domain-containing protein [Planctomycetaceae bacterium]
MSLVKTIREHCRVCYTCVRECPAKAIRIVEGQAEVIPKRCIGCGNCVRVCSQSAKQVLRSIETVQGLLKGGAPVAAILAPSFPAEFEDLDARQLVGMLRVLGFTRVNEVAFGADLVAQRYCDLLARTNKDRFIATSCPAVVAFVERYHPDLIPFLIPVVSPMVATARALRHLHGKDLKIVFIGPCIAKKGEAINENTPDEIDAALTFVELREMLAGALTPPSCRLTAFDPEAVARITPCDFDPPHGRAGALFPISRGLLQAAGINEDLMHEDVVVADGRTNFIEALREFESGDLKVRLLELLACTGCIMGPGMSCDQPLFRRRGRISHYVREMARLRDDGQWRQYMDRLAHLDLSRGYTDRDERMAVPFDEEIGLIMTRMGKIKPQDELNCGACGYDTCREHAVAIFKGLAESEMCLPHTIDQLRSTVKELAVSNGQLASTQEALMQSEKLASMGQLAAGIAHEVNNPLGVVLMYSHLLLDEADKHPQLGSDLRLIAEQADRCKRIVSGLLNFARQNKVLRQSVNVHDLVDRTLKALPAPQGVKVSVERLAEDPVAELDGDQITQVLTNLVSNAYAAMADGGQMTVRVRGDEKNVTIEVEDTGVGIPQDNMKKIFTPFFTTKQIGKGTGLGLAVTYGIVKMHCGDIGVKSNADAGAGPTGTVFTVTLPREVRE